MKALDIITAAVTQEAEDPKSFLKDLSAQQGEHQAQRRYHMSGGTKFYVVDQHGCITHYDYFKENAGGVYSFSGNWKVQGMSFHHWANHFTPWDALCSRMARAGSVTGYLWDLDHGSTRRWGEKATIHPAGDVRQEAEDPKSFLQQHAPPQQFEVDGINHSWVSDGQGNVLYACDAQRPRRSKAVSIKKFNVEEYHQRTGKWPTGQINLQQISYWDWRGRYFTCGPELRGITRPPR